MNPGLERIIEKIDFSTSLIDTIDQVLLCAVCFLIIGVWMFRKEIADALGKDIGNSTVVR